MRAGLRNSYNWVSQDMLDAVGIFEWRQLLFVMCYMHSIVQERRKFGPIGWNVPYEFNQSDLSACVQFLQNHLTEMDAKKLASPTWPTVTYMVSSIQYGGRITDGFDELLMDTYASKYFNQGALEKDKTLFPGYDVPDCKTVEDFRAAIDRLPSQDSPEIFGLHSNADLTFRTLQVKSLVETVVSTMPKSGGGGDGLSPAEIVDKIAEDLLSKVPETFEPEPTKDKLRKLPGGPTQPLTVHLRQEIDRLNIILDLTRSTLKNLRLAVAGTVALSGDLVDALDALFDANVPPKWLKKSWESSTIGSWFQGLLQRYDQLDKWLHRGRPKAYWMTGFFNPQGFLTAMKQEVNRKHAADKWALDDVVMTSEVTHPPKTFEALKDEPSEGVYIYGLFLEGCGWDGKANKMVDSEPKKLYAALPVLYVTGKQAKDNVTKNTYEAPTYRVKKRTGLNFISTFPLRTEDPPSKWITRGVALLCSVD
jgi:dynein heavy chain